MAETGYVLPATVDLEVIVGADFETTITFYSDDAQTVPFDLTGYACELKIGELFTLTSGAGLTITAAGGQIVARLTNAQTATITPNPPGSEIHWRLKLTSGTGKITYPIHGGVSFVAP